VLVRYSNNFGDGRSALYGGIVVDQDNLLASRRSVGIKVPNHGVANKVGIEQYDRVSCSRESSTEFQKMSTSTSTLELANRPTNCPFCVKMGVHVECAVIDLPSCYLCPYGAQQSHKGWHQSAKEQVQFGSSLDCFLCSSDLIRKRGLALDSLVRAGNRLETASSSRGCRAVVRAGQATEPLRRSTTRT
jgi:hypothetical protein